MTENLPLIIGKSAEYYVMTCEGASTSISKGPDLAGTWMKAEQLSDFQKQKIKESGSLLYTLSPDYPGIVKPLYKYKQLIMREDLLQSIQECGALNLEAYPAIIRASHEKKDYTNYFAVNIVGRVSCALKPDSKEVPEMGMGEGMTDAFFENLVIDEKEAKKSGLLIFRLAESVSAVIVHEKIRQSIEKRAIPYMVFYGPGQWAG